MLRLSCLIIFLASSQVFSAIETGIKLEPRLSIESFGIYQNLNQTELSFSADSTAGYHTVIDTELLKKTDVIPMQPDVVFGFKYVLEDIGVDAEWVPVEFEIKHPLMKSYLGKPSAGFKTASSAHKKADGRFRNGVYYVLREGHEMVPGKWQLTVRYNSSIVATQSFVVKEITP